MREEPYIHSREQDKVELERLQLQASIIDPITIRRLTTIGVAEGWTCLDVGAGAGSVAQWLSQHVGDTGRVVATDIDLRFLRRVSAPNLEIRQHNILTDDLGHETYDLVHCRLLLEHLHDPMKGLKRMAHAVRPSGWLLVEEWDASPMLTGDTTDAESMLFSEALRAGFNFLREKGIADLYVGRQVPTLIEQLGFTSINHEGWTVLVRGGDPFAQTMAGSWSVMSQPLITEKILTRKQVETVQRLFLEPSFIFCGAILFSAWGRKPR